MTGPNGAGPKTGRGLGYCEGVPLPNIGFNRRGLRLGRGRRRGWF